MHVREVKTIVISRNGAWKKKCSSIHRQTSPWLQLPSFKEPSQLSRAGRCSHHPRRESGNKTSTGHICCLSRQPKTQWVWPTYASKEDFPRKSTVTNYMSKILCKRIRWPSEISNSFYQFSLPHQIGMCIIFVTSGKLPRLWNCSQALASKFLLIWNNKRIENLCKVSEHA